METSEQEDYFAALDDVVLTDPSIDDNAELDEFSLLNRQIVAENIQSLYEFKSGVSGQTLLGCDRGEILFVVNNKRTMSLGGKQTSIPWDDMDKMEAATQIVIAQAVALLTKQEIQKYDFIRIDTPRKLAIAVGIIATLPQYAESLQAQSGLTMAMFSAEARELEALLEMFDANFGGLTDVNSINLEVYENFYFLEAIVDTMTRETQKPNV
jgi:hypothetical protein